MNALHVQSRSNRFSAGPTGRAIDACPRKRPPRWAGAKRGFTLIELLVAMAMVAILAVSLYASLRIAFRAKASAEVQLKPMRTVELAMSLIRTDLQDAPAPNGLLAGTFEGTTGVDDRGHEDDDLNFYSVAASPLHVDGNGEIKNVELTVMETTTGDHVLVRKVIRNLLSQQTMNPDVEVICRGVSQFGLQYYDGSEWLDTWDSTHEDNTLPVAVQVTLAMDPPKTTAPGAQAVQPQTYVSIIPLPCSTAATDTTVNPQAGGLQ